jgi:hypothetical protein
MRRFIASFVLSVMAGSFVAPIARGVNRNRNVGLLSSEWEAPLYVGYVGYRRNVG